MQVQWNSLTAFSAACLALLGTSWSAQAIDLKATSSRPVVVQRIAETKTIKKCITVGGKELCLIRKKVSPGGVQQAPGNGAPQGGAEAPQGDAAGQAGNGAPQGDNAGGAGGGNAAPATDNAGAPPRTDNGGAPAAGDADANLEPGEHVCPVGYLVLETKSKYGAFCEEVKGFPIPAGMESIERACPAGYIVLATPNKYKALCEPKEGFPGTPTPALNQSSTSATGFFCEADVTPAGHETYAMAPQTASTEAQAHDVFLATVKSHNNTLTGPVTCKPNP